MKRNNHFSSIEIVTPDLSFFVLKHDWRNVLRGRDSFQTVTIQHTVFKNRDMLALRCFTDRCHQVYFTATGRLKVRFCKDGDSNLTLSPRKADYHKILAK